MVVGIDGCRGGWYAISQRAESAVMEVAVFANFRDVLRAFGDADVIGVDMPIGLAERGERECDQLARRFLGSSRSSSIFSAPLRTVLGATSHGEASARRFARDGKRMSIQAFNILRKVAEVDEALQTAGRPPRVYEVHPEVSFVHLNGGTPLQHSKKRAEGREERLRLLRNAFGTGAGELVGARNTKLVAADDVVDALAVLWSAKRIAAGVAASIPATPILDAVGLEMAIRY